MSGYLTCNLDDEIKNAIEAAIDLGYPKEAVARLRATKNVADIPKLMSEYRRAYL